MTLTARYDGHADWYDDWNKPHVERNASAIRELLGPGDGLCLDLGCGSGHYFDVIAATGRTVVGLDYSADQLRIARRRSRRIVRGDATALPFADRTFPTVATMWVSTDVNDFAAVLAEAARVLMPGGCSSSMALIRASTGRMLSGWTTAGCARTPLTGSPAGMRRHHGGASSSASESGCATIRWLPWSTRSSAPG
jgi:ubiquinone/menaquinone biosynthesis C-methylase UbiE